MTTPTEQPNSDQFVDMSIQERQQYLDSGGTPPHLTDQQIAELPATQVEGYYQAREAAGIDEGGITGFLDRIGANFRAGADAQSAQDERMREYSSRQTQYVEGLNAPNHDYQGEQHASMTQYVADIDSGQIAEVSNAYHDLHKDFEAFAEELKTAIDKSQSEWEGEAADSARGYFSSLRDWSDANSQNAQLASQTVYEQSEAASSAKNSMPEEVPFNWEDEMKKWGSNPLSLVENMNNTIDTYNRSNEAHSEAAQVMTKYDNDLYTAASKQPAFAEPPKFGENGGGSGNNVTPPSSINMPGDGSTNPSGSYSGGSVPGGSSVPSGGSYSPGGSSTPSGGSYTPPASLPGGATTGAGAFPGATTPSGYQTPRTSFPGSSSSRGGNSNLNGMGAMPMGPMGAGAAGGAGGEYSSKLGRGMGSGGFGPGGSAGAGAASGAAKAGMAGAGGAAPGAAAAASGSGTGRGAMGGMGAGRGGGKGGEDDEHQRPTYLVEGDPDEVFGTDQRTAPPVIGE